MHKNILITGKIQCGKSTLINKILNKLTIPYSGYKTLPYYKDGKKSGYYIKSINLKNEMKEKISINISNELSTKCEVFVNGFDITGVDILKSSMEDKNSKIILLDEIGTLEKCSSKFMQEIDNCLNSEKMVIGVLKKKSDEFLNRISKRKDTFIVDIENSTNEERQIMKKQIIEYIENLFRCS